MKHFKDNTNDNIRLVLSVVPLRQQVVVVLGLFVSSLFELIGLAMIVPLLAGAAGDLGSGGGKAALSEAIRTMLQFLGLPVSIGSLMLIVVTGLALKSIISIAAMTYVGNVMAAVTQNIRLSLIGNLLSARWSFLVRQPLGRLTHAAGPEASAVGDAFLNLANLFAAALQALMYLAIALLVSWQLAIVTVLIGIFMFASFGHLSRRSRQAAQAHSGQLRLLAGSLTDAMIGLKAIKAMGRHGRFASLFEHDARRLSSAMRTRAISSEYASELQEPIIGVCLVGGFYLATQLMSLALHELVIMALLLARTVLTLSQTQKTYQRFITAQDQCRAVLEFLDETAAAREIMSGHKTPTLSHELAIDRVTFAYGKKTVLRDLSISIPKGKITAIVGPSGAGKSTIVDLIVGLYKPASGRVLLDGVDLEEIDLVRWRSMVGYVPQEVMLLHDTILRNVTLGETSYGEPAVLAALEAAGALDFVSELPGGLHYVVGERGNLLSGGQRQRIAIARALLHQPALLILDEATTGLDPETEQSICRNVANLSRKQGLTILAISHQLNWQQLADKLIRIQDGVAHESEHGYALRQHSVV